MADHHEDAAQENHPSSLGPQARKVTAAVALLSLPLAGCETPDVTPDGYTDSISATNDAQAPYLPVDAIDTEKPVQFGKFAEFYGVLSPGVVAAMQNYGRVAIEPGYIGVPAAQIPKYMEARLDFSSVDPSNALQTAMTGRLQARGVDPFLRAANGSIATYGGRSLLNLADAHVRAEVVDVAKNYARDFKAGVYLYGANTVMANAPAYPAYRAGAASLLAEIGQQVPRYKITSGPCFYTTAAGDNLLAEMGSICGGINYFINAPTLSQDQAYLNAKMAEASFKSPNYHLNFYPTVYNAAAVNQAIGQQVYTSVNNSINNVTTLRPGALKPAGARPYIMTDQNGAIEADIGQNAALRSVPFNRPAPNSTPGTPDNVVQEAQTKERVITREAALHLAVGNTAESPELLSSHQVEQRYQEQQKGRSHGDR